MKTLLALVGKLIMCAQGDVQEPRKVFLAKPLCNTADAGTLVLGYLQQL